MIRVRDLDFSYGNGNRALRSVDIEIRKGETVAIVGPNGSGKTTLLRCISGTLPISKGQVFIHGRDLTSMGRREIAKKMAFLQQEKETGFDFTVEETVSMGRYPYMPRFGFAGKGHQKVVDKAMRDTGVYGMKGKRISALSGGEKQRVFIARALSQEPSIMLLDEPTKDLDIKHALDLLRLIRYQNEKRGLTAVAVLHDLNMAATYFSRVVMFNRGRVTKKGSARDVLTKENIEEVFDIEVQVRYDGGVHVECIL